MKINFLTELFRRLRSGAGHDPVRDWLLLIALSLIALAGILVWNVWAFATVAKGGTIGPAVAPAPAVFSHSSMDTINSVFENRAAEEAKYVTGVYRFSDPSQ